ncbi:MAG TPA: DUF2007 domain-containing protein [Opitutaceae bacterium]|nr:DUF2007 domain-containing protein [Opitutaceae bacterium]
MEIIASFPVLELATLAAARLRSAGIEVELRDEATVATYWFYSPVIGGVKLAVAETDVADALAILREPPIEEGLLVCPHCGSRDVAVRVLGPAGAAMLIVGVPLPLAFQSADCRSCGKTHHMPAHPNLA